MMKIVYIYNVFTCVGCVEKVWIDKMNYLANSGKYDIYLITGSQDNHDFSFPLSTKVNHIDLNIKFYIQYQHHYPKRLWFKWQMERLFKKKLTEQIQRIDPDIMIATTYWEADVVCKLKCRSKKIIESHCAKAYTNIDSQLSRNPLKKFLCTILEWRYNRTIEKRSDVLVTLTQHDKKAWSKAKRTIVIPNIIPPSPYKVENYDTHRVIAAGRLTYQKGFDLLITAWQQVHTIYSDWKLDIYGKGDEDENLRELIANSNLGNHVSILPPTPHILQEFSNSSIYVLSSRFEGFVLVLAEAMGCGLPCVSFNCPNGPSDIINHQENGLLVENGNVDKLAEAISYLIENEVIRKEFGMKARESAKRFLPENIMPQWEKLFHQLTN